MYKYSKDGVCKFDTKWSSFIMPDGSRLRSWSKIIKQFCEQVDTRALAEKYVAKHGGDLEAIIAKWQEKADKSRVTGIVVHNFIDHFIQNGEVLLTNTEPKEKVALKFIEDFFFTSRLKPVESELVVYSAEHKVATLIDCIVRDISGRHYIIDWKTNGEIKDQNYGRYLYPPFNLLPDHDLMKYNLQLNFCKQLCTDYPISGMYLVHLADNGYKMIPVKDMQLNLEALCNNG